MIIKELKVKNFQIHEEKTIRFEKGLNVIVGSSGIGKSSLIRSLFLLIMNQPRSAEKIFRNRFNDKKMEIQIKDDQGNVIKRTQKKYYLNGQVLKAFGSEVPEAIKEVIPIREINFQKQLDPHFLIMQTGGNAAKILNITTGMEDQETLLRQVKLEISEHNNNIKSIIKENQNHRELINTYKNINRFLMKVKAIDQLQNKSLEIDSTIKELENLLIKIKDCQIPSEIILSIENKSKELKQIEIYKDNYIETEKTIIKLEDLCNQLEEVSFFNKKETICNKALESINSLSSKLIEVKELENTINLLVNITKSIIDAQYDINKYTLELKKAQKEFDEKLIELGECPLCGSKIEEK